MEAFGGFLWLIAFCFVFGIAAFLLTFNEQTSKGWKYVSHIYVWGSLLTLPLPLYLYFVPAYKTWWPFVLIAGLRFMMTIPLCLLGLILAVRAHIY